MECIKVQEYLMTDYIDGQLSGTLKDLVDEHLSHCHACQNLLCDIKKDAIDPLVNDFQNVPDEFLWAGIKQRIDDEEQRQLEKALKPDFWEKLGSVVHIPRPAFALVRIVTMIFMIGSTGQLFFSAPVMRNNAQDQVAYLSTLMEEPVDANNGNDSQTPIEKYFL